eukprot:TRINITY_DN10943_c0_g1_i1.p1 TRINITY_DN10943_c0_g1~~TRINITY_DN10943_c0_g1_i1.p1  ORF type:complete len:415 (+),score=80.79 TRINITY_DN10943_c0_g1_i1:60-1304(+)
MSEWVCGSCRGPITEECVSAFDKYYHFRCFKCFSCNTSIQGIACIEKQGKPYCMDCGTDKCKNCGNPITEGGLQALGDSYHEDCFVCNSCNNQITDGKFSNENGYPVCVKCLNMINKKKINRKAKNSNQTKCYNCRRVLPSNNTMLIALNKAYHRECFKCTKCKVLLKGNSFVALGNKPACNDCAVEHLAEKCNKCKKPICGTVIVALGLNWHSECFVCINCNDLIVNYGKVYRRGKDPCCPLCVEAVFSKRYTPPPQEKTGIEIIQSLSTLLESQIGIDYFLKFLVRDYSVENILFWLDVQQYNTTLDFSNIKDVQIYSKCIIQKYIQPNSELEINIDADIRRNIMNQMNNPNINMFDEAVDAVFILMRDSSFNRFLNSPECELLLSISQKKTKKSSGIKNPFRKHRSNNNNN